jgi:hypothetical protein
MRSHLPRIADRGEIGRHRAGDGNRLRNQRSRQRAHVSHRGCCAMRRPLPGGKRLEPCEIARRRNADSDLIADSNGRQQPVGRGLGDVGLGKHRRDDGSAGMTGRGAVPIVYVEHRCNRGIGECRTGGRQSCRRKPALRAACSPGFPGGLDRGARPRALQPEERGAEEVENDAQDRFAAAVFQLSRLVRKPRKIQCCSHNLSQYDTYAPITIIM